MKTITDYFSILDCMGGSPSGDYKKDVKFAEETYNTTFSEADYNYACQVNEQP